MKTSLKLLILATVLFGLGTKVNAQTTATATATGELVSAITISTAGSASINFGRIVAGTTGTVTVAGIAAPTASTSLSRAGGTITSAGFTISGTTGSQYTVTLPTTAVQVKHTNNADYMEVNAFSCDVATAGTEVVGTTANGTLTGTSRTFYVGATLNVKSTDPIGVYTSATFPVTVSYQ